DDARLSLRRIPKPRSLNPSPLKTRVKDSPPPTRLRRPLPGRRVLQGLARGLRGSVTRPLTPVRALTRAPRNLERP
ncbi:hypothetical protein P7K49_006808, partial [Saguinus oedipus]